MSLEQVMNSNDTDRNHTSASIDDERTREVFDISHVDWEVVAEGSSLAILCALAAFGNFIVPFVLIKRKQLNVPSNRFVFSLTASNLVLVLTVLPSSMISAFNSSWPMSTQWCYITAFLSLLIPLASILMMALIAVDRYFAIVRPMMYSRVVTQGRSLLFLCIVWLYALLWSLPPAFGWSRFEYRQSQSSCTVAWYSSCSYSLVLLASCVILPCIVMVACYYAILQVARKKRRKIHVGTVSEAVNSADRTSSRSPGPTNLPGKRLMQHLSFNEKDKPRLSQEKYSLPTLPTSLKHSNSTCTLGHFGHSLQHKVSFMSIRKPSWAFFPTSLAKGSRTVCLVLGSAVFTWFPFMSQVLVEAFRGPHILPAWYCFLSTWLFYSASVSYPVIYGLYNRSIRKEVKTCICPTTAKAARGLPRRNSRKYSLSGISAALMDHVPHRLRVSQGISSVSLLSRKDSIATRASSSDSSCKLGASNLLPQMDYVPRKPSQDSGAVMSGSDSDSETDTPSGHNKPYFQEHYLKRRASAPCMLHLYAVEESPTSSSSSQQPSQSNKRRKRSLVPFMRLTTSRQKCFTRQMSTPDQYLPPKPSSSSHYTLPRFSKDWLGQLRTKRQCSDSHPTIFWIKGVEMARTPSPPPPPVTCSVSVTVHDETTGRDYTVDEGISVVYEQRDE